MICIFVIADLHALQSQLHCMMRLGSVGLRLLFFEVADMLHLIAILSTDDASTQGSVIQLTAYNRHVVTSIL